MDNPLQLSIIVPVYNMDYSINYCLESLIDPHLDGRYEIICVNDGSTDNSLEKLKEWESQYPHIIRIVDKSNGGLSSARNIGMKEAKGKWLFFCDSDDYIAKNSLSSILNYISDYPDDLCMVKFSMKHTSSYSPELFEGIKGEIFYGTSKNFFLNHLFGTAWIFLYRRDFIIQEGIEFLDVYGCEDTVFNVTCLLRKEVKVLYINADVYRYVANPQSICHTYNTKTSRLYVSGAVRVLKEYQAITPTDDANICKRMQWVTANMLPNIFARMWRCGMTLKEYRSIKKELVSSHYIPSKIDLGWNNKIREFLLLHPVLFYLSIKFLETVGFLRCN